MRTLTTQYIRKRLIQSYFLSTEVKAFNKANIDIFYLNILCKERKSFVLTMLKNGIGIDEAIFKIVEYYKTPGTSPFDFVKVHLTPLKDRKMLQHKQT